MGIIRLNKHAMMERWLWLMGKSYSMHMSQFSFRFMVVGGLTISLCRTFLNTFISFVSIGLTLYTVGQVYTYFSEDVVIKRTVKCRYCRKWISSKVSSLTVWCHTYVAFRANIWISGSTMRELYQLAGRKGGSNTQLSNTTESGYGCISMMCL